jgi:hypothetical protein
MSALTAQAMLLRAMAIGTIGLAAVYLARVTVPRPPVGLFTRSDVAIMIIMLVIMPFAYLALPAAAVAAAFGVIVLTVVWQALSPVTGGRLAGLTAVLLCAADAAAFAAGWQPGMLIAGDLLIVLTVTGVTNLWAQAGMTPGHAAALAVALACYDMLATGLTGLTASFTSRVDGLPFAPLLAAGYHPPVFLGLGDCLLLVIWPLVAARAYGRAAGWTGALAGVLVLGPGLALMTYVTGRGAGFPLATPLGLVIAAQYLYWRRRRSPEAAAMRSFPGAWPRCGYSDRPGIQSSS